MNGVREPRFSELVVLLDLKEMIDWIDLEELCLSRGGGGISTDSVALGGVKGRGTRSDSRAGIGGRGVTPLKSRSPKPSSEDGEEFASRTYR